jgi:hypothetical protein
MHTVSTIAQSILNTTSFCVGFATKPESLFAFGGGAHATGGFHRWGPSGLVKFISILMIQMPTATARESFCLVPSLTMATCPWRPFLRPGASRIFRKRAS